MQARQVDLPTEALLRPDTASAIQSFSTTHALWTEVGATKADPVDASKEQQQIAHAVLEQSLQQMRCQQRTAEPKPQDAQARRRSDIQLQLHLTHAQALDRIHNRKEVARPIDILPPLQDDSSRHLLTKQASGPTATGGRERTCSINSSIPSEVAQIFMDMAGHRDTDKELKAITGQELLSYDDVVYLLCQVFKLSNAEWAAKCYPALFPTKHHHDKYLTLLEFSNKYRMLTDGADMDKMRFVFSIYDVDRSGSVDVNEVFETLRSEREDVWDQIIFSQQLLGLVDSNHDGSMGFQEFCTACQKIPMFFTCFTGALPLRLSSHPENVKYRLGLSAIRKMWSCGVKESAYNEADDDHERINANGFKTIISYFFRFARSSTVDQSLATRIFQTFAVSSQQYVRFSEFITGLSTLTQGTIEERGRMIHAILDLDRGGTITKNEIDVILRSRAKVLQHQEIKDLDLERDANDIMDALDGNGDGDISVEEFMEAVRKFPHVLEALQDVLFSGCRLDADFDSDAWKKQSTTQKAETTVGAADNWPRGLDRVPHPEHLKRDFKKVFVSAVKKVSAATTRRRSKAHSIKPTPIVLTPSFRPKQ
ncbi:hypothetical protein AeNC1_011446 [Aphanomyces euteiches]|nr:hypothetical protein AeNC1_011446 [Aphanomyces euteiches]